MSNFISVAMRPKRGRPPKVPRGFESVTMLDNYYGLHRYGVRFPDGKVYLEEKCKFGPRKSGTDNINPSL